MRSSTWLLPLLLLCSSNSGASGHNCSEVIEVRSNQVMKAQQGQRLEVQCPVSFCSEQPLHVSWFKITNGSNQGKAVSGLGSRWEGDQSQGSGVSRGVSYLTFPSLLLNHTGEYRCETNYTKGHFITINVTGSEEVSVKNETKESDEPSVEYWGLEQLQPYLWASAGVLLCVVVVISLSVVSLQHCPGNPVPTVDYQNTVMPMTQHASAHSNPGQAPPSYTPHGHHYGNRGEEEEEESIWYASLNHVAMPVAPPVCRRGSMQDTEYAAIRVA